MDSAGLGFKRCACLVSMIWLERNADLTVSAWPADFELVNRSHQQEATANQLSKQEHVADVVVGFS